MRLSTPHPLSGPYSRRRSGPVLFEGVVLPEAVSLEHAQCHFALCTLEAGVLAFPTHVAHTTLPLLA